MNQRSKQLLFALAVSGPICFFAASSASAQVATPSRPCNKFTDSKPSSLGADGWAAADGKVTGGCGALPTKIYNVFNRSQLVNALNGGNTGPKPPAGFPDNTPKIIYVHGTIDLNVDDNNQPLSEEDYMRMCNYTGHATFYDPATGDQSGDSGFFGA